MSFLATVGLGIRRAGRPILRNVSVEVKPGMVLAIIGPNGSGKSTLLRGMAGLWPPTEGDVLLDGKPLRNFRRNEIARTITYVSQEIRSEFEFLVREIVLMGRYPHRGRFEREKTGDLDVAHEALKRADAFHLADRPMTQLSGGERQRVLIARSLATCAHILLLDEPTANLDLNHALDVLQLCRSLADDGCALAIATHDLNAVYRFVDRVALFESGCLLAQGKPPEVLTPENVERAFRVRPEILAGVDGTPVFLFHRMNHTNPNGKGTIS